MKLIGKQIVVELPEKKIATIAAGVPCVSAWNAALSEVAKMNQAWEVDEELLLDFLDQWGYRHQNLLKCNDDDFIKIAQALASNPSAWMKRKE